MKSIRVEIAIFGFRISPRAGAVFSRFAPPCMFYSPGENCDSLPAYTKVPSGDLKLPSPLEQMLERLRYIRYFSSDVVGHAQIPVI